MKRKISAIAVLALCSTLFTQPVSATNSVETAEPMGVGKAYAYTYFRHIDDEDGGWYTDYDHYYSFTPKATDEYTVEVKGNWINDDTWIEINDQSGKYTASGHYNAYLKRVTATAKLYAGTKYYFDVWAGDESATPQVLTTTVNKHVHEFENKDYEKCTVKGYSDGYIDGYDGGYTKWCRVCEQEEYVTFSAPWSVKLSASKLTFNGKVQKPKVTVYSEDGKKLTSYRVSYPKSKAPGKYKLTITFTGDYSGTIKVPYTIVPAKPGAPKLKAAKGGFNASWKKAGGAEGYQIEWSWDKSFMWTDGHKVTKKPSFNLKKKFSKKSVVYVHVRSYKIVGGKKLYSGWSKAKSVKAK